MEIKKYLKLWRKSKRGSIFDEALLLGAKGLLLLIIIAGFSIAIIPIIDKITAALQNLSNTVPN